MDRLLTAGAAAGAARIAGRIGRAYVDLNRAPDELDPALIADCPEGPPPGLRGPWPATASCRAWPATGRRSTTAV